jgi:DNA-binding MarR family transcriptional regulator
MTSDVTKRPVRPRHPSVLAWLRLARVFQKIDNASARHFQSWKLSSGKLSTAQFDVLAQVGAAQGITQQELAGALFVTKGNISQILDRMEQQGLVKRCQDGRTNYIFLTEAGRRLYDKVVPAQELLIAELFSSLSHGEQTQLMALLRKLDHGLE